MSYTPNTTGVATESGNLATIASNTSRLPGIGQGTSAASQPVVLASDQSALSIKGNQGTTSTASWTSATTLNTALTVSITNMNTISVTLSNTSTMTAGVLTFEVFDGTNWFAVSLARIDSYTVETTYTLNVVANRAWSTSVDSFSSFRVRLSTVITGTGTANIAATPQAFAIEPIVVVGQATAANLNVTIGAGTLPAVTTVGTLTTLAQFAASGAAADATANPTTTQIRNFGHLFNGTTWDRQHGNWNTTTGDSGAKTTNFNGATQTNYDSRGAVITIILGTVTGTTPTFSAQLQYSPDAGTTWLSYGPVTGNATATGNSVSIQVYPTNITLAGATPGTLVTGPTQTIQLNTVLPRTWRLSYTIGGTTPSFTITGVYVNYQL